MGMMRLCRSSAHFIHTFVCSRAIRFLNDSLPQNKQITVVCAAGMFFNTNHLRVVILGYDLGQRRSCISISSPVSAVYTVPIYF